VSSDRDPSFWDTHDFWDVYERISTHQLEALTPEQRAQRSADYDAWRAARAKAAAAAKVDSADRHGWAEAFRRARPSLGELDRRS
jgi:hypothetical protein